VYYLIVIKAFLINLKSQKFLPGLVSEQIALKRTDLSWEARSLILLRLRTRLEDRGELEHGSRHVAALDSRAKRGRVDPFPSLYISSLFSFPLFSLYLSIRSNGSNTVVSYTSHSTT
jgi:hypothetical protein